MKEEYKKNTCQMKWTDLIRMKRENNNQLSLFERRKNEEKESMEKSCYAVYIQGNYSSYPKVAESVTREFRPLSGNKKSGLGNAIPIRST